MWLGMYQAAKTVPSTDFQAIKKFAGMANPAPRVLGLIYLPKELIKRPKYGDSLSDIDELHVHILQEFITEP